MTWHLANNFTEYLVKIRIGMICWHLREANNIYRVLGKKYEMA